MKISRKDLRRIISEEINKLDETMQPWPEMEDVFGAGIPDPGEILGGLSGLSGLIEQIRTALEGVGQGEQVCIDSAILQQVVDAVGGMIPR